MQLISVPVFIIGVALFIVGLEAAFAPEVLVFSAGNRHVFDMVPRLYAGLTASLVGALMAWEGWRGSKHYVGLFMGVLVALFFAVGSTLPALFGDGYMSLGPLVVRDYINGITVVMWLTTATLCGYYYITLRR